MEKDKCFIFSKAKLFWGLKGRGNIPHQPSVQRICRQPASSPNNCIKTHAKLLTSFQCEIQQGVWKIQNWFSHPFSFWKVKNDKAPFVIHFSAWARHDTGMEIIQNISLHVRRNVFLKWKRNRTAIIRAILLSRTWELMPSLQETLRYLTATCPPS